MIKRVIGLYYSPRGGTAAITEQIVNKVSKELEARIGEPVASELINLLDNPVKTTTFDAETLAVIGMPSRIGKLPIPGIQILRELRGSGAMTINTVSYGSRSYGNALYELYRCSEEQGFKVIGAGAFVVKHPLGKSGQMTRPDMNDLTMIADFAQAAGSKINRLSGSEIVGLKIKPAPIPICGKIPTHRISRISPSAAAFAEHSLERICPFKNDPEWFL